MADKGGAGAGVAGDRATDQGATCLEVMVRPGGKLKKDWVVSGRT